MYYGLILTLGSLFFITLLMIIYFQQQRFLSIKNKLYRYMLIAAVTLTITELVATLSVILDAPEFVKFLTYRIHWFNGIVSFSLLFYYCLCFIKNLQAKDLFSLIRENKIAKGVTIFIVLSSIGYFFFPFNYLNKNNISYIPGIAAYYVLAFCAIIVIIITIINLKRDKNVLLRKRSLTWILIIELVITYVLQLIYMDISTTATGAVLAMYSLYFIIENPDLKIIEELENVKNDIERSNKAKSDFLSNMSHEIRSPMNAIVGFSETLLNDPNFDPKAAKADIKHISNAGNNLLDIINNILDISKIESGKEILEKKEYSMASIVMELVSIVGARIGDKPIKLVMDVDKNIPSKLYGDSTKLFSVLLNILTNSVKYTEVGKIKLSINGDVNGDVINLHFKISDTGYGIKKEDYDKLFEKFSRLDTATSNEIEGTGLGLVITKKYVDLMGGKIWFESEYEVGTTFYVDLTQKIVNNEKLGNISEPIKSDNKIDYINCNKYKILIVDDNKLNIKVATRLLEPYKFSIDTTSNGKDCIYKVKSGIKYDMIFLDHMMPEMDGIETLHIIKKLEDYQLSPIVALTANAITGMKEMYLKEGFDEYLSKPINVAELNKLIIKYFDKKEGENNEKNI